MRVSRWGKQSQCNTETASEILRVVEEIKKKVLANILQTNIPATKTFPLKKNMQL